MKTVCLVVSFLLFSVSELFGQSAQYATAGNGTMRNYISWFDWAGVSITNNSTTNFTTADGMNVTVKITNVTGPPVLPNVMNTWWGAVLWQLYDFTNPGVKPALFSYDTPPFVDPALNTVTFTMDITATRAGVPTPFTFVAVDAEGSDHSETTTFTTDGTAWRTIEFFRNSSQTVNPLVGCGTNKVDLSLTYGGAPSTGQNPVLATDANSSLKVTTRLNRTGGGGMAVAFGIFSPIDRGDLPVSYSVAHHGLEFSANNSCNYNPPYPSIVQQSNLILGNVAGDADGAQTLNDNTSGADEDAVSSFSLYNGTGSYSIPINVKNTSGTSAFLKGWFDYNRDGIFSNNEATSVVIPNGATSATLSWAGLPANLGNGVVTGFGFRFRLASNSSEIQDPGGFAKNGEVEDYLISQNIIFPQVVTPCVSGTLPSIDFGFQQNMCDPLSVQFTSSIPAVQTYEWDFGNGQKNNSTQLLAVSFNSYGNYSIKLSAVFPNGCIDSVVKTINISNFLDYNLIVNSDTTICLGDSILIKTEPGLLSYCWNTIPSSAPSLINSYIKPTSNSVYRLTTQVESSNLVVNGDFSGGNLGFTSQYNHAFPNITEGQYWVGTSPNTWNPSVANCKDHTTGSGQMITVNGSPLANAKVWSQTINVTPNTNYNFTTWIQSLSSANPANLQFAINNINLGNSIISNSNTCQWKQFSSSWNSGNNTTATITIVNNNTIAAGNDFALDDIYFGQVITKTDSLKVTVVGLCDSIKLLGTSKVCNSTDTLTYSIYKSAACSQQYTLQVDNSFATIISQTSSSVKLVFRKNGRTTIKVSYANNCKMVVDSLPVDIKFSPAVVSLGPDVITCRDTSVILNAGSGFESYVWQNGKTDSIILANVPGTYSVVTQNLCGIQLKDSFKIIKILPAPFAVSPANVMVCKADSLLFNASGGSLYSWQPSILFNSPGSPSAKALINSSQVFTVSIIDAFCGRDTVISIPIQLLPPPQISISKSNDVNCENDSAVLTAKGGVSYTWSPALFISRTLSNGITVKPPQSQTYIVTGKDASGCQGKDSIKVNFTNTGNQKMYMPNAFSPNGDRLNETFRPTFIGPAKKYEFRIYNRWGQLIFKSSLPGVGWDGKYNSILQPNDVYVYHITAEGNCNGKFEQKGTFVLIK